MKAFGLFFVFLCFTTPVLALDSLERTVTEEQKQEAVSVFELCMNNNDFRRSVDCQCLKERFLDLRLERGSDPERMHLVAEITRRECRNIEGTAKMEYESCMVGTGFKYYDHSPEEYCKCYSDKWAEQLKAWEGKLDESKKSTLRFKARRFCKKSSSYN